MAHMSSNHSRNELYGLGLVVAKVQLVITGKPRVGKVRRPGNDALVVGVHKVCLAMEETLLKPADLHDTGPQPVGKPTRGRIGFLREL